MTMFDLDIMAVTQDQATQLLSEAAELRDGRARVVVTPNVDHVVRLDARPALKTMYAKADFIFADGMPLVWFSKCLKQPLPERVTGSDLFIRLCQQAVQRQWRVALLGGRPGQEAQLQALFEQHYPGLQISIRCPSMRFDPEGQEGQDAAAWARDLQADVVFVCLGLPKQERWALQHAATLPGGVLMCVGAAMEFAVGLQQRAPQFFQRAGLEWLWRLGSNPRHLWRRYLVDDPKFLVLCWREWRSRRSRQAASS